MKPFGIMIWKSILTVWASSAAFTGILHADLLINFDAGPGKVQTGQAVLGYSANDVWNGGIDNAIDDAGDTYTGLVDSNGNPLPGVAFTRTGAAYQGSGTNTDPSAESMDPATTNLMEDFLWVYNNHVTSSNPIIWTLSGLSAYAGESFTYVIYSAGGEGANSQLSLAAINGGGSAETSGTSRRISDGRGVAYVSFTGNVDALGQVQFSQWSYNYNNDPAFMYNNAVFDGAQIQIVPEPSTAGLLITGIALAVALESICRRNARRLE